MDTQNSPNVSDSPAVSEPHKIIEEDRKDKRKMQTWKAWVAIQYIVVCLFDFILAPAYRGIDRPKLEELIPKLSGLDVSVQIKILTETPWEPLTLQGGSFYHIAMGAILTGVAIMGRGKNA